jgi:hypothetical protein
MLQKQLFIDISSPEDVQIISTYLLVCESTIKTIASNAKKRPAKFILVSFSLKTKTPVRLPIIITPIFIPAKTVEGFWANA